eukprot:NODE_1244_length_1040_cov_172.588295_g953_i0.p1 GENE.NODE_1244_length_1040_cov_172.588295_g953_i0~~NODE_1244_length_1040_cov_172.588295_g953_i0.p1  ORF type:complete len:192 (-),score=34.58 NODE_1244_length_1040_cov_172.588295_g953_i0:416-991(-)
MAAIKSVFNKFLSWMRSLFWKQEMELTLVGLQAAGKTTLLNVISEGKHKTLEKDTIPTVGLNTRKVSKGNVSIKLWDIGGQPRFRAMWERYCRGVNAIVYVVDSADSNSLGAATTELHELLSKPALAAIPLLVLGNKSDLTNALKTQDLIDAMDLKSIKGREVCCYSISAKNEVNIDVTLDWLIKHSKKSG